MSTKGTGYHMLAKNFGTFSLYPRTLRKVEFMNDRLIGQAEETV